MSKVKFEREGVVGAIVMVDPPFNRMGTVFLSEFRDAVPYGECERYPRPRYSS